MLVERLWVLYRLFKEDHLLYHAIYFDVTLLSTFFEGTDDLLDKLVLLVLEEVGRILGQHIHHEAIRFPLRLAFCLEIEDAVRMSPKRWNE